MIYLLLLPLILSEILANEPGSTVTLEWIEVEARETVDLADYRLIANGDTLQLPAGTIDSGQFTVVCRDTVRFEFHYGDSSGTWDDHPRERYALHQAAFSLPNSSGAIELIGPADSDRFAWDHTTPDGVSFERISDTVWQVTGGIAGATPGERNYGAPAHFDWALTAAFTEPAIPHTIDPVTVIAVVANTGTESTATTLQVTNTVANVTQTVPVAGESGTIDTARITIDPTPSANTIILTLAPDGRWQNNTISLSFIAAPAPIIITEIYAVPEAAEPEWLELYITADTAVSLDSVSLADARDTTNLHELLGPAQPGAFVILTENAAAFLICYPHFAGIALQPPTWPSLNNTGDTLTLLLSGVPFDITPYRSFGSKRGVSLERVGASATWGFSAAPDGATPGQPNSIDVPYSSDIELAVTPNPFAAGNGQSTSIRFTVPFAAEGELRLYAGDGRQLRTLLPLAPIVSGEFVWDGRDHNGALLPVGVYLLYLKLTEPAEQSRLATVVIAR